MTANKFKARVSSGYDIRGLIITKKPHFKTPKQRKEPDMVRVFLICLTIAALGLFGLWEVQRYIDNQDTAVEMARE